MFEKHRRVPAAVLAGGLIALAALLGCGGEESVASKSAAAFEEAQKRGETFGGEGHAHGGHSAVAPGGEHAEMAPHHAAAGEEAAPEHHHGPAGAPAGDMPQHAEHRGGAHAEAGHGSAGEHASADHSAMGHGQSAASGSAAQHAGHGTASPQAPAAGSQPSGPGHAGHATMAPQAPAPGAGHAGHSPSAGGMPLDTSAPSPGQPARTLSPSPLDAPAATSVLDAQRSAEMAGGMAGMEGHGGHGEGTYRHVDAGRGPEAYEGSEPQTPGAEPHQHGPAEETAAVYACPMHPEVTSSAPGTCPKCGMTLVKRRKG
jgi:hypothetical protein